MEWYTDTIAELRCGWPVWCSSWQTFYCPKYVGHPDECVLPRTTP